MSTEKTDRKRNLIYVDASGYSNNESFKISMYNPEKNATHILELKDIKNSTEAEIVAIFYAIFYIKKHNFKNCHILCDNKSAINDKHIILLAKNYNIGISWIPREANIIADKVAKLEATLKEKDWNILKLFIDLARQNDISEKKQTENKEIEKLKQEIDNLKKLINTKEQKIKNQANQINILKNKNK